jgi:hypothetical protein
MTSLTVGARKARIAASIAFLSLIARSVGAQADSAAARALFSEGRDLMEAERFEEACPKFEESLRLDHGMGTQFNLAHCWEKVGRTASAWALFLDVAAAARAGNQLQRETAARERAKALEAKLSRLRIAVLDPAPNTKVMRDDQEVGRAAWGTAMPIDPGDHVIRVTAPGKQEWSQDVTVPATARTFSVTVPALGDLPVTAASNDGPAPASTAQTIPADGGSSPPDVSSNGQTVTAVVVGGLGIGALAAGTIFAIQSRSDNEKALTLCRTIASDGSETCVSRAEREQHQGLVDDAKRGQILGYVGFGLGGAALITATVLYLTADTAPDNASAGDRADSGQSRSAYAIDCAPLVGPSGWGAVVMGSF